MEIHTVGKGIDVVILRIVARRTAENGSSLEGLQDNFVSGQVLPLSGVPPEQRQPGAFVVGEAVVAVGPHGVVVIVAGVHGGIGSELLDVVHALDRSGPFAGLLKRREQHGGEDGDDRDNHQKLDQRETTTFHDSSFAPQYR